MILIDTSVWIEFLRGAVHRQSVHLAELLEKGEAALCEVTFSEICFGARNPRQFLRYKRDFGAIPFLPLPIAWHTQAAEMGFVLRSKGHKPFLADLMIALTALSHAVPLFTLDRDFLPYQRLLGLELLGGS